MKNKLITALLALLCAANFAWAQGPIPGGNMNNENCQDNCFRNSISINTGYNHSAASEYPTGQRDEYWQVVEVPAGGGITEAVPYCAYVIEPGLPFWNTDFPNPAVSQWISAYPTASNTFNNWTGGCPGAPFDNAYRLQRKFFVCTPNATGQFRIDLEMMVDDVIDKVWVDGTVVATFPCVAGNYLYANRDIMSVIVNLAPGPHTITMDMRNVFGVVMGVNAQGRISSADGVSGVSDPQCYGKNSCACINSADLDVQWTAVMVNGDCQYTATVNVSTGNTILGYEWTVTGQGTVVHNTSSTSDSYVFTVPAGTGATVTVVIHAVNPNFGPGEDPCCTETISQDVFCKGEHIEPCEGGDANLQVTPAGTTADGDCIFNLNATAFPPPGYTVQSYQWSATANPTVTHTTSALSDAHTITLPNGTSGSVTVVITFIDPQGRKCTVTLTRFISCEDGKGTANKMSNTGLTDIAGNFEQVGMSVYPNPTSNAITVSSLNIPIETVMLTDVSGRVLDSYKIESKRNAEISLNAYPKGVYILKVNGQHSKMIYKE